MYMCDTVSIEIGGHCLDTFQSGAMAATFDVGGMIGKWQGRFNLSITYILLLSQIYR